MTHEKIHMLNKIIGDTKRKKKCFKSAFNYSPKDKILSNDLYRDFQ